MSSAAPAFVPETFEPHGLHRGERDWTETNCYVDVWIEVLHALGHEPLAGLGFALRTDLEADQWTFFKFAHDELFSLFGIDVIELNPWQSVVAQMRNETRAGNIPLVEVDAYFLPDTAGTTYRVGHAKTTIGIATIDPEMSWVSYFHSGGFYRAAGDDYAGLFPTRPPDSATLPPYIEVVKPGAGVPLAGRELVDEAVRLLKRTMDRIPRTNPFTRYSERFATDMEWLREGKGSSFHSYAFANHRQFGAAFSLASAHLAWLRSAGFRPASVVMLAEAERSFAVISTMAKTLQFQAARSALAGKTIDASSPLNELVQRWEEGMSCLHRALG